jgi:hypothetical protein
MAKIAMWVLWSGVRGELDLPFPIQWGSQATVEEAFERVMRAEWEGIKPKDEKTGEPLPYPGDPDEAYKVLQNNPECGLWAPTSHEIETKEGEDPAAVYAAYALGLETLRNDRLGQLVAKGRVRVDYRTRTVRVIPRQ